MTGHQSLQPLIERKRSYRTYSARLTRWLGRLAHFTNNVNHIAGEHTALKDYLSRNPISPPQTDDEYDEEYVINSILPHYNSISKCGCLSNHINQSENKTEKSERKVNNKPRTNDTRQQTAIDCLHSDTHARKYSSEPNYSKCIKFTKDARTIDNIEASNPSAEAIDLGNRSSEIVKHGIYRMTRGRWKRYNEPKFLRIERNVIEGRLQQRLGPRRSSTENWATTQRGFQSPTRHAEQSTVDPFSTNKPKPRSTDPWKKERSTRIPTKTSRY